MPLAPLEKKAPDSASPTNTVWEILFSSTHVIPAAFTSAPVLLLQICLGLPTFLFPCGFQSCACRITFDGDLRSVWPIHPHFLFLMFSSTGACFVLAQSYSFEIISGHLMFMLLRRPLTNVCNLFLLVFVVRHVSDPRSMTA